VQSASNPFDNQPTRNQPLLSRWRLVEHLPALPDPCTLVATIEGPRHDDPVYALTSDTRSALAPDVPTFAELGSCIGPGRARDRATLLMTMPAVIPVSGSAVPIAVIRGCKVKGDASAIRRVTVIICRIGVWSRVPRVGSAGGVAPISSGLGRCGCGNS
jgi:hypothetical protein